MNTPPLHFHFARHAPRRPLRIRPYAGPIDTRILPSEVHAARAFARLAGLDFDGLGLGGRPRATARVDERDEPASRPVKRGLRERAQRWWRSKVALIRSAAKRLLPALLRAS